MLQGNGVPFPSAKAAVATLTVDTGPTITREDPKSVVQELLGERGTSRSSEASGKTSNLYPTDCITEPNTFPRQPLSTESVAQLWSLGVCCVILARRTTSTEVLIPRTSPRSQST
jgi:hypothetical protein